MQKLPQLPPLLKQIVVILLAKKAGLLAERDTIETLVLGSSHGDYGFDPAYCPGAFNLCSMSQDLKYSYYLYKYVNSVCGGIKNIALLYSVFSPGNHLEKSPSENGLCPAFNEVFELGLPYENEQHRMQAKVIRQLVDALSGETSIRCEGSGGFFPEVGKVFIPDSYGLERRASEHLKLNGRTDALIYLRGILQLARVCGQRICLVIPPARSDYRAVMSASGDLFRTLREVLSGQPAASDIGLLDCYSDERYVDAYFGDFDHLLPEGEGCRLFSRQICTAAADPGSTAFSPSQRDAVESSESLLRDSARYLEAGKLDEVGILCQAVLERDPKCGENSDTVQAAACHGLARVAVETGRPADSLPYFVAAINADPACGTYWIDYIDALILAGDEAQGREVLAMAQSHGLAGEAVAALAERLAEVPPAAAREREINRLLALFAAGRYRQVLVGARALVARHANDADGWKILGTTLKAAGQDVLALPALRHAVALAPGDVQAHFNLGVVLQALEQLDEAAQSYRTALALDPAYADAALNLGVVSHQLGRPADAERCYRNVLSSQPDSAVAHHHLGFALLGQERTTEAEACFQESLRLFPGQPDVYYQLGLLLHGRGKLQEAEAHFRIASLAMPDDADVHIALGDLLTDKGELERSIGCYREAARVNPDDPAIQARLDNALRRKQ